MAILKRAWPRQKASKRKTQYTNVLLSKRLPKHSGRDALIYESIETFNTIMQLEVISNDQ
jgi:hypothetical protein